MIVSQKLFNKEKKMPKTETLVIRKGDQDIPIQVPTKFKVRFDKKYGEGILLKLFNRFSEERDKFVAIGREFHISAQWVGILYKRFFHGIPVFKFGLAHKVACSINRRLQKFQPTDAVRWVWEEAIKHNCVIRAAITENHQVSRAMVMVNGHKCQVRGLRNTQKYKDKFAEYAATSIRGTALRETDMQIFVVSPEGEQAKCFIVPTEVLLDAYRLPDGKKILIHIPVKKLPNRHQAYIDWWQYKNAWHLLGGKSPRAVRCQILKRERADSLVQA